MDTLFTLPEPESAAVAERGRPENTVLAYRRDWEPYRDWCTQRQRDPASAKSIGDYLVRLSSDKKPSSVRRAMHAIFDALRRADHDIEALKPYVWGVMRGIVAQSNEGTEIKLSILTRGVQTILARMEDEPAKTPAIALRRVRDRAIILFAFSGALTKSELRGLDVEDLGERAEGLVARVNKSDQLRRERAVLILRGDFEETDPVGALKAWLVQSGITSGPVFRGVGPDGTIEPDRLDGKTLYAMIRERSKVAGIDVARVAFKSLRSGFAAQAAVGGVDTTAIVDLMGLADDRHIRPILDRARSFAQHPQRALGL